MSAYIQTLYTGIVSAITTTWTDVLLANGGGGVIRSEIAMRIPFPPSEGFPYVVIDIPELRTADWGLGNDGYQATVDVYRVQTGPEDISALLTKLEALRDYLRSTGVSGGQVLPDLGISTSPFVSSVSLMLSKHTEACCGRVSFTVLAGLTL